VLALKPNSAYSRIHVEIGPISYGGIVIRPLEPSAADAASVRQLRTPRWAAPTARRFEQNIMDARVSWVQVGSGPPLLLLHGYSGSARSWVRNITQLARTHTVYALDLPGFGASRMPGRYTLARAVDLLAAWMESNAIGRADLVGHSMGGQITMLFAGMHPGSVRRMVLIAPAGLPFTTHFFGIAHRAIRSRLSSDPRFTPITTTGALRAGPRILWQAERQIQHVDVRSHLEKLTISTLILWGSRDRLLPVENAAKLAALIASAEVIIVPGASHLVFFEQAERVNEAILSFLARP
jgi:pimeloyl-ACP methyl ester carboxylesterase